MTREEVQAAKGSIAAGRVLTYSADFKEFVTRIDAGEKIEIDEEMFDYWLEVLPPAAWRRHLKMRDGRLQGVSFGAAEGYETIIGFWRENGKLFAERSTVMNPHA